MHRAIAAAGLLLALLAAPLAAQPPNILWITVEDMSPQLGCYGDDTVPTPNLDRLAGQGVRYTRAFSTTGVCAPSRCALITGMHPTSIGAHHMRTMTRTSAIDDITDPELLAIPTYEATPPPAVKCFTEYLRAADYYCTNNAKTDYQFATPITAWDESSGQAHWRNRPEGKPFFAVFNFTTTHESKVFQRTSPEVTDPAEVDVPPYYPDTPLVRRDIARNYDNIARMDRQVGELLEQLAADGLADETIVLFFSDHGTCLPRGKRWVYDSGTRVPLIVRYPDRREAGTTADRLVSFVDFAPSVLSLAGISIPDHMQGQAFLGERQAEPRKYVFMHRDRMDPAMDRIRAARDERFQYVRNFRPNEPYIDFLPYRDRMALMQEILRLKDADELGPEQWQFASGSKPIEELYDTQSDPHQIMNLAGDPRHYDKLAELRQAVDRSMDETGDLGHLSEPELIKRLWPPDGKQPTTARPKIELRASADGEAYELTIRCATDGASVAYRLSPDQPWQLYHRPLKVDSAERVEAQATRIGFKPSGIVRWTKSDE
ncbi:MAG: sulfatase [Pirellulales bacterium]